MLSLTFGHVTGSDEKRRVAFLLSLQEQEQGRQCTRPFHAVHLNDSRLWNGLARETKVEEDKETSSVGDLNSTESGDNSAVLVSCQCLELLLLIQYR